MAAAAAVVGGMVASGVIKVVIKQIGSAIGGKIKLHKNLKRDLEKMKMTLESVEAALSDAERRSITDSSALLWVNRLKAVMYDISDMLDDFESDAQHLLGAMRKKINMPNRMKRMQELLQKITEDRQNYSVLSQTRTKEQQVPDIWENAGNVAEAEIIGRVKEKLEILARLSGSTTEGTTFVPIWGFGGIGKTTLARLVYNDPLFKKHSRVWVYVSPIFDLKKIGNTIISQLSEQQSQQIPDLHSLSICLQTLLCEKKNILIILDGLWEKHPSQLEELKDMLKQGEGCKVMVVVTTRDKGIANEIGTVQPYNLPQLSDEMCWEIMRQKSKFETRHDKERLEPIGRDIAKKCKGVALAAQSLGHMLKSKTYGEWNSVRTNHIWNISTYMDGSSRHEVLGSLLLSYNFMPPHLKLCFAYCAIFPKGHNIIKNDLIHQWIALGFMELSSTFSNLQLGESYLMQLVEMSFLQPSKPALNGSFGAVEGVTDRWGPKSLTWHNGGADGAVCLRRRGRVTRDRPTAPDHISLALSSLTLARSPSSCSSPLRSPPATMVSWSDSESTEGSAAQYISSSDSPVKIPATIDEPSFEGLADDLNVMCEHGNPGRKFVAFEGISTGRRFIACASEGVNNCGLVQWVDEHWPEHLQNALHKLWLMYEDSQHNNKLACLEHSSTVHNLTQQRKELQETYEKLVEDVNNLLDSQDNQPEVNQKNVAENITISVESSMAKDAEIKKWKAVVDQLKLIHVAQASVIRNLKFNHLKEKEKMSSNKRTLEICYADLKKEKDDLKKEKDQVDCCIAELMKEKEKLAMEKSTLASCIVELKTAGDSNKRKLHQIKVICDED